jgi:hypothetical protein
MKILDAIVLWFLADRVAACVSKRTFAALPDGKLLSCS